MNSMISHKGVSGAALAVLLLTCMFWSSPVSAQDERPDPNEPITVDFVQKDIHTVMHYIALRSGLQIIVEGEVNVQLTVMFRDVVPKEAIESICKANKLDFVQDGQVIIIKRRQQTTQLANVVASEQTEKYNVSFESHELVEAIMEVAKVTQTEVSIPSISTTEQSGGSPDDPEGEREMEERAIRVQQRLVSMYMREADADAILRRLQALGKLELTVEETDGKSSYHFTYPPVRFGPRGPNPEGPISEDVNIISRSWQVPGGEMNQIKSEVSNILTPYGKVVTDDTTDFIVVYDDETNMDAVAAFLDHVAEQTAILTAEAEAEADINYVVREYRVMRDIGAEGDAIVAQLSDVLTENGRLITNPDRNSIVVYETTDNIGNIDEIMMMLDTAPEQVLITSKLIEVTLDDYMGYGLELFTSHSADNLNDGRFTGSSEDSTGTVGGLFGQPTGFDPFFATFTNPRVDVRLELLANEGRVETLSQPTQMVSNRQTARIEVGQEVPYLEASASTAGSTTATVSFKEVSIVMEVTPTVLENGLIRLDVTVTVREVIGNVAIEGNNTPVLSKRESQTNVFIHDGETLVMGGLMRERERMEENGLPFLKDIPFLGYLFKSANRTTSKTDLLFFLRPQIVTAGKRAQNGVSGLEIERDLRPLIYEDEDSDKATIRDGRYRRLGTAAKPKWYNDKTRPKKPADVKPGA